MHIVVSKKDTMFGPEQKFASVIRAQIWPVGATKGAKHRVVRFFMQESFKRCLMINNFTKKPILMRYVAVKMPHPKILEAWMPRQEETTLLRLCDDVFVQQIHSVDEHKDMMRNTNTLKKGI
jgi:hypothetical protein